MAQWGKTDTSTDTIMWVGSLNKKKPSVANAVEMYANTTAPGVFAIAPGEINAMEGAPTHAGWVLRKVGSGGRAGRISYETLVATGSITGDSADAVTPNILLAFTTPPGERNVAAPTATTFTVVASATPTAVISYQWQVKVGAAAYVNVVNGGVYTNATTATLNISNTTGLGGNRYRCVITATNANPKTSTGALLTVT
jgi:hypothetical protein